MVNDYGSDNIDGPGSAPFPHGSEFPPTSSTVQVVFGAQSRCGPNHALNEDHYAVIQLGRHQETLRTSLPEGTIPARFDEYGYAMVLADGMGPSDSGELASRIAIGTLMHLVLHF